MAKSSNKPSLFDRAMNLADRFFEGVDKLKKMSTEAEKQNVEFLDQKIPGFKESHEKSMQSAAKIGSNLEAKTEKILFGKDFYLGAGGKARKAEAEKAKSIEEKAKDSSSSIDNKIRSAATRTTKQKSDSFTKQKEPGR